MGRTVIIIQHLATEGPGTIAKFFYKMGQKFEIIRLYQDELLPSDFNGISGVVIMGGSMNVYEEDQYPFLKAEDEFIRRILKIKIPLLGICLGAQLLAKACGAKVEKAPIEEIGFFEVTLTPEGKKDTLFKGMDTHLTVFHWHTDSFQIPEGGVLLAKGKLCENQAFRIGKNAYGIQFHPELTQEMLKTWVEEEKLTNVLNDYYFYQKIYNQQAEQLYTNFLSLLAK
jgi:GMP synthase-like glutamine amidotransferase